MHIYEEMKQNNNCKNFSIISILIIILHKKKQTTNAHF